MRIVMRQPRRHTRLCLPRSCGNGTDTDAGIVHTARRSIQALGACARWNGNTEPVFREGRRTWDAIDLRPRGMSSGGPMISLVVESSSETECQRLGFERSAG